MKQRQSLAGYIREHLAAIEQRLELGIRQDVILEELEEIGYKNTTIHTLRTLLSRARKKRAEKQENSISTPSNTSVPVQKKQENVLTKAAGFDSQALKNQDSDLI